MASIESCCKYGKNECCGLPRKAEILKSVVDFLDIMSDTNRLKIMCVLRRQALPVSDIWQYLDVSQNLVSHHLKVLKEFGLLDSNRDGKKVIYSINKANLEKFKGLLTNFI